MGPKFKKKISRKPRSELVEFGGIIMSVPKTSKAQYRKHVADGVRALALLPGILSKPGEKLKLNPMLPPLCQTTCRVIQSV